MFKTSQTPIQVVASPGRKLLAFLAACVLVVLSFSMLMDFLSPPPKDVDVANLHPVRQTALLSNNCTPPVVPKPPLKVLYFSRHARTIADFTYVAKQMGVRLVVERPQWPHARVPKDVYEEEGALPLLRAICSAYDFIVVGDVNPDGRPFMSDACVDGEGKATVILQTTQRFDYMVEDPEDYQTYVNKRLNQRPDKIKLVVNNPYEPYFMCRRLVFPRRWALIRPSGHSPTFKPDTPDGPATSISSLTGDQETIVIVVKMDHDRYLAVNHLLKNKIKHRVLEDHYGGPKTLATYKAFVHIPYQVSVMSFTENLAAGVAYLLPTARFYAEIITQKDHDTWSRDDIIHDIPLPLNANTSKVLVDRLVEYQEWWQPELRDVVVYFDSWEEMVEKIRTVDFEEVGRRAKDFMVGYSDRVVKGWKTVFGLEGGLPETEVYFHKHMDCGTGHH